MSDRGQSHKGSGNRKVFLIGLDCAAPELVFHRWRQDLPVLTSLAEKGLWGDLESCTPAITVPAWSCMFSGKDPGELGIYGFRNRADHSYDKMFIATSNFVREKQVWDYLSEAGKECIVVGVPQTYPVKPLNGHLVAGFLAPGIGSEFTFPPALKEEVLAIAPEYDFDVRQFRTEEKDRLLRQIWETTEKRFLVIDHLLRDKPWDFFALVEIGVDRIHHGFWSYHDPQHRKYEAGNPFEQSIHDYYVYIDRKIGEWLEVVGDETCVLVVSDHGAKRMDGGICINEWLWKHGYLAFVEDPKPGTVVPFDKLTIDWSRTRAWGEGGYYGRVFLNVEGREPNGQVKAGDVAALREELAARLAAIPSPEGKEIGTRVFKPEEIYRAVRGVPPDLIVYFGNLLWRSVGSVGYDSIYTFENDTGPDDCNHAQNGMFIFHDPARPGDCHEVKGAHLMDVASTVLDLFDLPIPADLQGCRLSDREAAEGR